MSRKNQNSFTVVQVLIVILALTAIFGVGFYVFNPNKDKKDTVATDSTQSSSSKSSNKAVENTATPKNAILFQGTDYTDYEIAVLAETNDQKEAAAAISAECKRSAVLIDPSSAGHDIVGAIGTADLFNGKDTNHNYRQSGNFMMINAGCYDKTVGGDQGGGGAGFFLLKQGGKWTFLTATQDIISCSFIDGKVAISDFNKVSDPPVCHEDGVGERAPRELLSHDENVNISKGISKFN